MSLSQNDLDWFAARLSIAVHDTKQEYRMAATSDLQRRLGIDNVRVRYGDNNKQFVTLTNPDGTEATVELDVTATTEEIAHALNIQKINKLTETPSMATIAEQLKAARAQLAEARQGASNAVSESAEASKVVLQEANKVLKEASDLRAEVAELTNGGPA